MSETTGGRSEGRAPTAADSDPTVQGPPQSEVPDSLAVAAMKDEIGAWKSVATARWAQAVSNTAVEHELRSQLRVLQWDLQQLMIRLHSAEAEARELQRQMADLRSSTSWRLTSPIRSASGAIRRARERM